MTQIQKKKYQCLSVCVFCFVFCFIVSWGCSWLWCVSSIPTWNDILFKSSSNYGWFWSGKHLLTNESVQISRGSISLSLHVCINTNLLSEGSWTGLSCPLGKIPAAFWTADPGRSNSGASIKCSCPTIPSGSRRTPPPLPAGWWWASGSRSPSSPGRTCWPATCLRTQPMPSHSHAHTHTPLLGRQNSMPGQSGGAPQERRRRRKLAATFSCCLLIGGGRATAAQPITRVISNVAGKKGKAEAESVYSFVFFCFLWVQMKTRTSVNPD